MRTQDTVPQQLPTYGDLVPGAVTELGRGDGDEAAVPGLVAVRGEGQGDGVAGSRQHRAQAHLRRAEAVLVRQPRPRPRGVLVIHAEAQQLPLVEVVAEAEAGLPLGLQAVGEGLGAAQLGPVSTDTILNIKHFAHYPNYYKPHTKCYHHIIIYYPLSEATIN